MLAKIIDFSIHNKLIIGLFVIALIGYGSYQVTKLPIDAVPDITNNQVQVITVAPSLGATDIERLVTFPIELANSNISGLHEIRSFSRFGLSLVTIVFDDDVDVYWARQQVAERLQQVQADLPQGVGSISMGPVSSGLGEIYQYTVRAKEGYETKYDAMELRTIQDWVVRRQLLGVKGVADVSSFGGKLKQYEIAVEPTKLKAYNLTITDVFNALENNNQNTGGAYIEKGPAVLYIRSEGLLGSLEDIKSVFIKNTSTGAPVLIGDVAEIRFGHATRYGAMCYNDKGEVAGAVVMMLKGANSSDVIKNVKERVAQIQKTLPEGVLLEPFLDRTKMVNNAIGTVETNLLEGALIVLFVLILFLGNLRAGFLVASVIPLAMLFAVILMNQFGVIGNLMSLGALDFGLIVDGAVFIVEAVLHQLTHSKHFAHLNQLSQKQMDDEVSGSSKKIARSVVFGQLIILIVYLPTFALQGIEGKMFIPMAQTVAFALLGAFILSITYIPMMSALIMSKTITHKKTFSDKMMEFFERHFQNGLSKVLNYPKTVIGLAVALFAVSMMVLSGMGGEFIPALEEGDFAVETRILPGSNLNATIERTQQAAHILKTQFPEVQQVVTKIGSGEIPTDPMPMEAADMMIILKDKEEWTSAKTFPELSEKMSKAVADVPGILTSFQYPVQMRFNELMTGAKQDVVCKIFGENMDTLAHFAAKLGALSASVEGTKNIYVEPVTGMPQIIISYNRAAIAQFGLSVNDVNRVINTGLAGQSSGFVFEGEKKFDMVVRINSDQRKNLEDVKNLLIPTPSGSQVPLYQLAEVALKDGPNQIQREDAKRRIVVGFNVGGRDVQSIVEELQNKVDNKLKLPAGYYISYGGAFENLNAAKARLGIAVPIALLLIFLLLYFSFNSIKQGLLIYSAIPLSAVGGIFALALRDMPFSISAGVGFIALFGVAVLNGIVLIAEFNRLKEEGWHDTRKIVLMGTKIRLRPVLMTAFVASLGFLPMAISNGAGAEVQRPLATVVIGGLLLATFLTLFVLPILYILFEKGFGASHKNSTLIKTIPTIIIITFFTTSVSAQTPLSLKAAIDSACANNLYFKTQKLNSEAFAALKKSAFDVSKTAISAEYGQINSAYTDSKFSVSQSLKFPTVYVKQNSILNQEWKNAELNLALRKAELRKEISLIYVELQHTKQLKNVLVKSDSLYALFLKNAELRFSKGESNILEKNTASLQQLQINMQLQEVEQSYINLVLEFNMLLNTHVSYTVEEQNTKLISPIVSDSSVIFQHPHLRLLALNQTLTNSRIKLEKANLLPDLFVGYTNGSITGVGADNNYYARSNRFQAIQAGIGIPLFFGAQKSKISALKIHAQIAANETKAGNQSHQTKYKQALQVYTTNLKLINYYESSANNSANEMLKAATQQFNAGEINYLEWVMLTNQAISIQTDYLSALKKLNNSIIELNYLTNQY
ncbi:MAG: CusA/CzcA family heavy metal efflux RND transporter [Bacteroidetes bacterium]|nr:CusA/CzcA family heavy metal efflux RND transporter [Bacteroidota bacterium]